MIGLIDEEKATKEALEEAYTSLQTANGAAKQNEPHVDQAVEKSDLLESNMFGYDGSIPAPAPVEQQPMTMGMPAPAPVEASVASGDQFSLQSSLQLPPPPEPAQPPQSQGPVVQTVSSEEEGNQPVEIPQADPNAPSMFGNEFSPPAPQPVIVPLETQQPPAPQAYGFGGDVMGGSASQIGGNDAVSPAARSFTDSSAYGYDEDSYKKVEELKKKALAASEVARDAETASRRLANESDELRQDADQSEATARSLRAAAEEKKKGRFGSGKKQKMIVSIEWPRPL